MKKIVLLTLLGFMVAGCQCNRQDDNTPEIASEKSIMPANLGAKYMIVAAAYRQPKYAERKVKDLEQKGYPASIVNVKDGLLAVVICPSDDLDATMKKLEALRGTDVCPQDAWILTND